MYQEDVLHRIRTLLSRFQEEVKIDNANGEFSINSHSENVLLTVLNLAYGLNLKNVNYEEGKTYPAIDLRDETNRVAFQITSTGTVGKVVHTLRECVKNNMDGRFDHVYFYFLKGMDNNVSIANRRIKNEFGRFKPEGIHFLDHAAFYRHLNELNDPDMLGQICNYLEKQFADPVFFRDNKKTKSENEMTERIQKKVEHKKEVVLKQLLFPWFKHSPKYKDVFPELFIDPHFMVDGGKNPITDVTPYFNHNLMILGDAGAGKSTFLRTWFVFKEKEKKNNKVIKKVLLFDAKEYFIEDSFLNNALKYLSRDHNDNYLLLIDAIDEAFYNDYTSYTMFILQLQELNNCSIWMGCRKDFYKMYSGGDGMNLSDYDFYIQEWDADEINEFIRRYAIIREIPDLPRRIDEMKKKMGSAGIIEELMRNPFQLSIIVFLAEDPEVRIIRGRYDLYEQFMTKWNQHEKLRGTSRHSEEEKEATLFQAALCVYCNKIYVYNDVAESDTGVNSLLRDPDVERNWGDGHKIAYEFYHRSLAEFILAKVTIKSMHKMNNPGYEETFRRICKTKMKDDVTNFILDKFLTLGIQDKYIIKDNLQRLYASISESDSTVSLREQIIYFLTRLDIDVSDFIGKVIDANPTNNMIRLSLAYGCTLLEDVRSKRYALDYAKAIVDNPNGEEAVTSRARAVIFYGDFHGEEKGIDEYSYRDEEKGPWKKVRESRIQRFEREKPRRKDLRFWVLDIPLFHNFLISRGWNDISYEEYEILKKLQFSSDAFDSEERQFLIKEHSELLEEYYNHLQVLDNQT